ncbi:MAG: GDP-mannose 4,6-dehydratase [bacterium]
MRVLVLGASGFVGRHLLAECRSRGDVLCGTYRPGEEIPAEPSVTWSSLDLLDTPSIEAALEAARPEGIVHLAGQANVAQAHRDPLETFRLNAEGTLRVLDAQRRVAPRARTAVVASGEMYGAVPPERLPVTEDQPPDPRTPYGISKACADAVAAMAARGWGLSVVRMRPFNHVGEGQRRGFVVPDFASQIAAIERGEQEPVLSVGNLSPRRDFTDVRDVVRAYREALERGRAGEAYNVCSGRSVSVEEIARFLIGRARVPVTIRNEEARRRPQDLDEIRGDASKAKRELGWAPEIPWERSVQGVLEEWRRGRPGSPR